MADLIDRQAVQEMVDRIGGMYPYRQIGNRDSYSQYNEAWTDAINRVDAELNSLPSAQPEIINCGDCRHWDKTWTNDWAKDYHYCPVVDGVRKASFYCADAERSDGNE